MADDGVAPAEKGLTTWDKLSIAVIVFPGCTEPHIESVAIDRSAGTITHTIDEIGREPEKTTVIKAVINDAFAEEISNSLLKHYRVARSEKSTSEKLAELEDDEEAKAALMKEYPPGIGGYTRELMAATIQLGAKKSRLNEEFSGSVGDFLVWLRTLPNREQLDTRREQGGADQPATAPESKLEGNEKPKPESEVRPQ